MVQTSNHCFLLKEQSDILRNMFNHCRTKSMMKRLIALCHHTYNTTASSQIAQLSRTIGSHANLNKGFLKRCKNIAVTARAVQMLDPDWLTASVGVKHSFELYKNACEIDKFIKMLFLSMQSQKLHLIHTQEDTISNSYTRAPLTSISISG